MARRRVGAVSDSEEPVTVEVARQLVDQARAEGVKLTGPGGLLGDLTKRVLETALEGEMEAHLGYSKHDPTGRDGGGSSAGIACAFTTGSDFARSAADFVTSSTRCGSTTASSTSLWSSR